MSESRGLSLRLVTLLGVMTAPLGSEVVFAQASLVVEYDEAADYEVAPGAFEIDVNVVPSVARRSAAPVFTGNGQDGALATSLVAQSVNSVAALATDAAVGDTQIRAAAGNSFQAGDLVLIVQMQGFDAVSGDQAPITDLGNVGRFELARIVSVAGANLRLAAGLSRAYTTGGTARTQVVLVPEYTDVTITAGTRLVPNANWSGATGGIVALAASGTLTINGDIDASAAGFRGGPVNPIPSAACSVNALDTDGRGARKGEGIDRRAFTDNARRFGRGNYANGGGGGNPHNAGGGGGSNGGAGGFGGFQWNCGGAGLDPNTRGMPGARLGSPAAARLFLGGGGGGGQQNDGNASTGRRGGGIVLLFANTVTGAGRVLANGASASNTSGNDGAGGGGAGGTIYLVTRTAPGAGLLLRAAGGNGGNVVTPNAHGPGGGGGGGRVFVSAGQGGALVEVPPGSPGTNTGLGGVHGSASGAVGGDEEGGYVQLEAGVTGVDCFQSFTERPATFHQGELRYLVSRNGGLDWETWNGLGWVTGARRANAMDAATLSANIAGFAPNASFNLRVYLLGDAAFSPAIDQAVFIACACGDGSVDPGEACDDGNLDPGDGCSALCTVEPGFSCTGSPSTCVDVCGDGRVGAGEECDDGAVSPGDGCSETCTIEPGFACTGQPSVCAPNCGNGSPEAGESCDDGNVAAGDGCSASCLIEEGYGCVGAPSVCTLLCGNGTLEGAELCDDGNLSSNDGCSPSCLVEPGYACTGEPSVCVPLCGDGTLQAGESCDDGNSTDGDGCASFCAVEPGWTCAGSPSVCSEDCGDGLVVGSEICDDGNLVTETCGYGVAACLVCDASCQEVPGATSLCGDGTLDVGSGESCDDGNVVTEACPYGRPSCVVCDASCQEVPGAVSACGDGVLDPANGEVCDDGNLDDEDGCDASCLVEEGWSCEDEACAAVCGDGLVRGEEACDAGGQSPSACVYGETSCLVCDDLCALVPGQTSYCGDAALDAVQGEVCDDGNSASGDGCSSACAVEPGWRCEGTSCASICGDGLVVGLEACDHGGAITENCEYGQTSCEVCNEVCMNVPGMTSFCGDGATDAAEGEACDDGNTQSGDGCSERCQLEAEPCEGDDCEPLPACGDGVVQPGEGCDDDNVEPGDGCSASCQVESGYECEGEPSVCDPEGVDPLPPNPIDGLPDGAQVAGGGCSCRAEDARQDGGLPYLSLLALGLLFGRRGRARRRPAWNACLGAPWRLRR